MSATEKRRDMRALILRLPSIAIVAAVLALEGRAEPIPIEVRECVGYVLSLVPRIDPQTGQPLRDNSGNPVLEAVPLGTAFVAMYRGWASGEEKVFVVTAKHVVYDEKGLRLRSPLLLRLLNTSGVAADFPLPSIPWLTHDDSGVDLAVMPGVPAQSRYRAVQSDLWLTEELVKKRGIEIGDEVFYTGLLPQLPGGKAVVPIVRFGRLALITDERLKAPGFPNGLALHFVDSANMPGHSGSPVFLWATPTRDSSSIVIGRRILALYGVVSNMLLYHAPVVAEATAARPVVGQSAGVTGVVPVRYLREIMESDKARAAFGINLR
jgi:hypothetical protein